MAEQCMVEQRAVAGGLGGPIVSGWPQQGTTEADRADSQKI